MRVRFLTDENVANSLVFGLRRRVDGADIVRVHDVGLRTLDDPTILAWAADNSRLLVSHDVKTIPTLAYEQVIAGLPMPGVFVLRSTMPIAVAIDELELIAEASEADEWAIRSSISRCARNRAEPTCAYEPAFVSLCLVEQGRVAFWHAEEGWGAVEVPGREGVGFTHFSQIVGVSGYRELLPGEPVEVEFGDDHGQDGCEWRVASVRPCRASG